MKINQVTKDFITGMLLGDAYLVFFLILDVRMLECSFNKEIKVL